MRALLAAALSLAACVPVWKELPHDRPYQRVAAPRLHRAPASDFAPSDWWDIAFHSSVVPLAQLVSPAHYVKRVSGGRPALDVNAFGEVPDSAWFENRIGKGRVTPEQLRRGAGEGARPAPGALTVVSGKLEGATPGMVVRDTKGTVWFVKFDPPAFRGLATAAEAIAARLLWAAGYHVPETRVIELAIERLVVSPEATRRDDYNRAVPMTAEDLRALLTNLNPDRAGRLRALVSRSVPGQPIGPFSYRGVRPDDPNDRIPHERRRSLRGLWVFSAWLNNTDTRRQNTLDTFIPVSGDGELGYVRHYLIDFGDALGSGGDRVKYIGEGYEEEIDWPSIFYRLFALGLEYPYWLEVRPSPFRSVGVFEARIFDPERWTPAFANSAFDEATARDTFWAASILARFDREFVEAAASAGRYRSEEAAAYVTRVLMERRDKLLDYAFRRMAPLADPVVRESYRVEMTDLEVLAGVAVPGQLYRWEARWARSGGPDVTLARGEGADPDADLREAVRRAILRHGADFEDDPFLSLSMRRVREGESGPQVSVHLRVAGDHLLPVALDREVD